MENKTNAITEIVLIQDEKGKKENLCVFDKKISI